MIDARAECIIRRVKSAVRCNGGTLDRLEQTTVAPQRRRHLRSGIQMSAHIRISGGSKHRVRVTDLSRVGFQMECLVFLPTDRPLILTMPGFATITCSIAWSDGRHYGCTFEHQLHDAIYDHIVATYPGIVESDNIGSRAATLNADCHPDD